MKRLLALAAILLVLGVRLTVMAQGKAETTAVKAMEIADARKANATLMRQYTWRSRIELIMNGAVKDTRIELVNCGPAGQLNRTVLNDYSANLPIGFLMRAIAEHERHEVATYLKGLTAFLEQYTLPTAGKVLDFMTQAQVKGPDASGAVEMTGHSVVVAGGYLLRVVGCAHPADPEGAGGVHVPGRCGEPQRHIPHASESAHLRRLRRGDRADEADHPAGAELRLYTGRILGDREGADAGGPTEATCGAGCRTLAGTRPRTITDRDSGSEPPGGVYVYAGRRDRVLLLRRELLSCGVARKRACVRDRAAEVMIALQEWPGRYGAKRRPERERRGPEVGREKVAGSESLAGIGPRDGRPNVGADGKG